MKQIEYKIREVSQNKYSEMLEGLGATKVFEGEMSTVYYDNSKLGFVAMGKRLSLRTKGDQTLLTYKNKYSDLELSVSDEYEVVVDEPLVMNGILEGMGYTQLSKFHKRRVDYKVDNAFFSFDRYIGEYSFIPEFLTIESDTDAIAYYWADELGIDRKRLESITILDLVKQYRGGGTNGVVKSA